jgi:hypothetical protein
MHSISAKKVILPQISKADCPAIRCIQLQVVGGIHPSHYETDINDNCWSFDVAEKKQCETGKSRKSTQKQKN